MQPDQFDRLQVARIETGVKHIVAALEVFQHLGALIGRLYTREMCLAGRNRII